MSWRQLTDVDFTDEWRSIIRQWEDLFLHRMPVHTGNCNDLEMLIILKNAIKSRQIYKGKEILIKVYITMSENHYHVISNIVGFMYTNEIITNWETWQDAHRCIDDDTNDSENCISHKCKITRSDDEPQVTCELHNDIRNYVCLDNHTAANVMQKDHLHKCKMCHKQA